MSKQAILIQCHKNPEQVNMLLDALQHPDVDIYIHVDKKSSISSQLKTSPQIHILPDKYRVDVQWATFSQVRATLNLLRYASHHEKYEHYWLCSGQDYPIKPVDEIVRFLHSKPDTNFIQIWNSKNSIGGAENNYDKRTAIYFPAFVLGNSAVKRIAKRALVELTGGWNRTFSLFRRKAPDNVKFFFGSSWICFSGEMEEWMESYLKAHPEYIQFYRNVNCPDECFFQTLVMNSPYKDKREDYLHYVDWSEGGNSPKTLTIDDYGKLLVSDKLMARKFDTEVDRRIIDEINGVIK